jgi:hypothetical protein
MDVTKWGYTIFNEDYTSANCWGYNLNKYNSKNILPNPLFYMIQIILVFLNISYL